MRLYFSIELQIKEKAKKIYENQKNILDYINIEYLICKEICIPINEKKGSLIIK